MRFTWGHAAIAIPVTIVVVFTTVLIISMSDDHKTELVTKDYYKQEIQFQKQIDQTKNALLLKTELTWKRNGANLILGLKGDFKPEEVTGHLKVYRPSDSRLDFEIPLALNADNQQLVSETKFVKGKYQIQVRWNVEGKDCYLEKNVFIQ